MNNIALTIITTTISILAIAAKLQEIKTRNEIKQQKEQKVTTHARIRIYVNRKFEGYV